MNKSFKVVFNKARGALMVVNEVTSCVQAKGTKTVIAAAVAALAAGVAGATEIPEIPEGVKADTVEVTDWKDIDSQNVFETGAQKIVMFHTVKDQKSFEGDLWVVSKNAATSAKGFYVNGEKADFINEGNIYITSEASWKNQAILADVGGKATNEGLIVAKNAYGMTVGTTSNGDKGSTIINNNRIVVEETGVGMELGGADGSTAVNEGEIVVGAPSDVEGAFTHGVLIKDTSNNEFTNYGTIEAAEGATAIEVQVSTKDGAVTGTTAGNILNFEAGSKIVGEVHIQDGVTGTVINANGFQGELALNNDSEELTINVKDGADLQLKDGYGSIISDAVVENGKLTASIWQSYEDANGEAASDNIFEKVVVKEDGIFNVKQLNSGGTKDKSHDTLLIKGSEWTLDGGALQVAGQNFTENLKVGTASDESSFTIESGDYSYDTLTVAKKGTVTVEAGALTVGDLTLSDGTKTQNNALVYVEDNGSLIVNGTLSAKGAYTAQDDGKAGVYVMGDLTLGSNAKLDLGDNALTIDGELNAAQNQIFKAKEGEDGTTTYTLAEGADKIVFTDGAGLLLSDNVSMTQEDFTKFLQGLEGNWKDAAPDIVFTNVAFQGDVTFDAALGYNTYATEVGAGKGAFNKDTKTTTLSVTDDVAVGALKVDVGTEVVDLNHAAGKEFVFAGVGGNVITGVDSVKTITSDGEVTLGWDETSKGVVNAETLEAKELFVSGQFEATNAVVTSGEIDRFGSLKLAKLSQADGAAAQDVFTIHQEATLNVQRLEIETNLEQGATLVIGDRLAADTTEGVATLADEQLDAQIAAKVTVTEADSIATTNANGRNLLKAVAGDKYDASTNSGLYVDDTVAVDREKGKLFIGNAVEDGKEFGDIGLGASSVTVIDVSAFADGQAIFVADKLHVNENSTILLKGADRVGSFTLVEGGEVNDISLVNDVLKAGDTNAWLGYTVAKGTEENAADTFLNVAFEKQNNVSAEVNAFAESVLTAGSESLGVVNAIGTTYRDETTGGLSNVGAEALDEYMALPAVAGTYNAAYDAAEQVWNTIGAHNIDRTAGKTNGVWADVFYSANEAGDMYGNGYGYEADVYGGVLGYDYTAACGGKIGAALTIGTSDVDAKGDFIGDYGNDADFWGLSIYASKDITEKMIVSADITYLSLDNDIKGSVAGASVAESIDSSVISVGLRADWKAYESNAFEIVPHAGIRYAQIDVDDYREMDGESLDVLEMPIGVAFNGKFEAAGMKFVPTLDFTVVPQIGDTEVHPLNGDTLDVLNNTYNTTLGISAEYGDFTFGVAAKYGFGTDDRSNAGVKVNATYAF